MAKAKRRGTKGSAVKKQWFPIIAPRVFNKQTVGEMFLVDAASAMGRLVPINLMNLTGDMRKQNFTVYFKINNITNNKLFTDIVGYEALPSSIKRLIRRGKNKIDYSLMASTSDGYKLRVKLVLVTRNITKLSSLTSLRRVCDEALKKLISNMTYESFISELIGYKIQMGMKKQLSKIYPLKICEIRYVRVIKEGAVKAVAKESAVKDEVTKEEVTKKPAKKEIKESA